MTPPVQHSARTHARPLSPQSYLTSVAGDAPSWFKASDRSALSDILPHTVCFTVAHQPPIRRTNRTHTLFIPRCVRIPVHTQLPRPLVLMPSHVLPHQVPRRALHTPYPASRATYPRTRFRPIQCFMQLLPSPGSVLGRPHLPSTLLHLRCCARWPLSPSPLWTTLARHPTTGRMDRTKKSLLVVRRDGACGSCSARLAFPGWRPRDRRLCQGFPGCRLSEGTLRRHAHAQRAPSAYW
ncbi:hypothetical protein OH76DRAFT_439142 [Lentinus brumalis]|uniref:Uncharacterized protein n=1 Tax=Lentinus brumalis TaxID=2498619 RepID=A0A371DDV5_9APHY|nr:hypothetical protein OH76DRAFT_439142 [Polyporus brumalis]